MFVLGSGSGTASQMKDGGEHRLGKSTDTDKCRQVLYQTLSREAAEVASHLLVLGDLGGTET